ncbi:hypothetical protein CVT24_008768 [Panaeolus cyanescens]|uniref:Histone acetyltransferase n=1 Tax=Panaeolus cyanescens TaxID=181874 RepID=A0A409VB37_9AGAR|nr:hypothetical protein CVT24_008768 [Panaeolus cyanescens]
MRSLVFTSNIPPDREHSYDQLTQLTNTNPIPIDPALESPPIDPALMTEDEQLNVLQPQPQDSYFPQSASPFEDDYQTRQYSQAPQGDPFAPQILSPYIPVPQEELPLPHKAKRKRKTQRFDACRSCQSTAKQELMVTCHECGRKDHPTCLKLENLVDVVRSYPWKCPDCKSCEAARIPSTNPLTDFLPPSFRPIWSFATAVIENPPIPMVPMPPMPPFDQVPLDQQYIQQEQDIEILPPHDEQPRESSVASTSRSAVEPPAAPVVSARGGGRGRGNRRGRGRARIVQVPVHEPENAEAEEEAQQPEEEEDEVISRPARRGRAPKLSKTKAARVPTPSSDGDRAPSPVARPAKRKRVIKEPSPPAPPLPRVRLRLPAPRGKGKEKETDEEVEPPHGLFDEILSIEDRDTTKTTISQHDKLLFEKSKSAAEARLAPPPDPPSAVASSSRRGESHYDLLSPIASTSTARPLRSATLQHLQTHTPSLADINSPAPSTPGGHQHPQLPKFEPGTLRIRTIRFGQYDITTWYDAPFPEEYATIPDGRLWICEFCLKYMKSRFGAIRHQKKCKARHPPGDEIYRDGDISIFEVDGRRNKIYCQNLCLLSKMFLDHKSLFYDVEPFLFYVITKVDDFGARFVGYFSKEKRCSKDYNLSCIMTLPVRQRQGWGNLLIDFSYLLSKVEQRVGSPEKPLSGLGALGYKNYWTLAIMRFLATAPDRVRLEEISSATSMTMEDVCNTLIQQNMIFIREPTPPLVRPSPGQSIRHPRGRKSNPPRRQMQRMQSHQLQYLDNKANGSEGKGPFVPPQHYEIRFDRTKVNAYIEKWESKGYLKLKPDKLQWTPYKVTRKEEILPTVPLINFNRTNSANADADEQMTREGTMEDGSGVDATTASVNGRTTAEPVTPARGSATANDDDDAMNVDEPDQDMLPDLSTPRTTRRQASLRSPAKSKDTAKKPNETPSTSQRPRRGIVSTPIAKREEEEEEEEVEAVGEQSTPPHDPPKKRKGRPPLPPSEREKRKMERQQQKKAQLSASAASSGARKLRSRGSLPHSTPMVEDESVSTRSTRRGSAPRRSTKAAAVSDAGSSSEEEEGESAAVEDLGERQLRSRRSGGGAGAPTPPRPSLVRKRSRIVTSPLDEEEEEEESAAQPEPDEDADDEDAEGDEDVPVDELPNGHLNGDVECTDMAVDSPQVNGTYHTEADNRPLTKTPETTEQLVVVGAKEEFKAEDVGTPLTNLTSRQSVPSDDTIFAVNGVDSKFVGFVTSQAEVTGPKHAESDLRSTLESELDDCHDEDADGEDDMDASGEEETEIMTLMD